MDFVRIERISDPLFRQLHDLLKTVFPADEVLEFDLWEAPLQDEGLRVCVAVDKGQVVGATEYRYYPNLNVAMTDFTIIGRDGRGIGRFLFRKREDDLRGWAAGHDVVPIGMFAEIYDPYRAEDHAFGGIKSMNPYVRREVLSHMGYKRLDIAYVHPSWKNNGEAVHGLDLCFLPADEGMARLPAEVIASFLTTYYAVLSNKPPEWVAMIERLHSCSQVPLLPM